MAGVTIFNILSVAILALIVWYFFDSLRAREIATAVAREYCNQSQLQFLDGTVGLRTVAISVHQGRLKLKRRYEFHYSESDHSRKIGLVTLKGNKVDNFILQHEISAQGDTTFEG